MTDDLVKRLREVKDWWREPGRTAEQAADRIEELQKEVSTARRTSNYWKMGHLEGNKRIEHLEAALTHIWAFYPISVSNPHETIDAIRNFASNALEEKKDD